MNWYKKLYMSESAQSSIKSCFYKRTSKLAALIIAGISTIVYPDFLIIAGIFFSSALLIDIVNFIILKKKESTYKNKNEFEKINFMNLEVFDSYHSNLVKFRILSMGLGLLMSHIVFNNFTYYGVFYFFFSILSVYFAVASVKNRMDLSKIKHTVMENNPSYEYPTSSTCATFVEIPRYTGPSYSTNGLYKSYATEM